jgi:uncharacterized protein
LVDILKTVAQETGIPHRKVASTIELLDQGNTIPFIARYRKEVTGELDENQIREIEDRVKFHRALAERKADVIRLIDEQGKLTEELRDRINRAAKPTEVEDLYLPYRPKRRTRASMAREKGLEPLAAYLLSFPREGSPEAEAEKYLSDQVPDPDAALQGAMDIVAEMAAEEAEVRQWVRQYTMRNGYLSSKARDAEKDSVYRDYYENYRESVAKIVPHRVLAINRGEREEFLMVSVEVDEERILDWLFRRFIREGVTVELVRKSLADAYKRLVAPAIEREIRNQLTENAEAHAITIFSRNLRSLLLQPPVRGKVVLGVDPAYRTGCKWAVVDETGKLLEIGVVYPTPPQKKVAEAERVFARLIDQYGVEAIICGNGTASRETEQFIADFIKKCGKPDLNYTIVNEAGASVYSASKLAAAEFPDLDVSERSAVSIARRIQDPLAELVKIPPQAIGVGQYQHDIAAKRLEENLEAVVESVVNYVGVDLNTASAPLLSYVAGIKPTVANNIVQYRESNGRFKSRQEVKKVPRLGPKTFEQCAGFLRIMEGETLLDMTPIHPESYDVTHELMKMAGLSLGQIGTGDFRQRLSMLNNAPGEIEAIAGKTGVGVPTLKDIVDSLMRPGRDPREELPPPIFRTDVIAMEDLKPGMQLQGTVRNVTDFGAFVDIGVKRDGLVHISELADRFVRHPLDVVSIGDTVTVWVLSVDIDRGRISLSMKDAAPV